MYEDRHELDYDWDDEQKARAEAQVDLAYKLGELSPKEEKELQAWVEEVSTRAPF